MNVWMRSLVGRSDKRVLWAWLCGGVVWLLVSLADLDLLHVILGALLLNGACSALWRKTATEVEAAGKAVLITGCDTGFGHALAERLSGLGFHVLAACLHSNGPGANRLRTLRLDGPGRLEVLSLDVTDDDSVTKCLNKVKNRCKEGLWALVNNAGINALGDAELTTMEQYRRVAEVNLFGMILTTKACLPLIRKAKGRVVNITCAKGQVTLPSNAAYCVSKAGAEAFSDELRLDMSRFGVKVIVIEPGNFGGVTGFLDEKGLERIRTDLDQMEREASEEVRQQYGLEAYLTSQYSHAQTTATQGRVSLERVLRTCQEALQSSRPQPRYLVDGGQALDLICILVRLKPALPDSWMDWLLSLLCLLRLQPHPPRM